MKFSFWVNVSNRAIPRAKIFEVRSEGKLKLRKEENCGSSSTAAGLSPRSVKLLVKFRHVTFKQIRGRGTGTAAHVIKCYTYSGTLKRASNFAKLRDCAIIPSLNTGFS